MPASKKKYDLVSVPSDGWDSIMETVTLDKSYSQEIRDEIWGAIEKIEFLSFPWIALVIKDGKPKKVLLFNKEERALIYAEKAQKKLSKNTQIFCIQTAYQRRRR